VSFSRGVLARTDVLAEYSQVRARLTELGRSAGATVIDPFDSLCPDDTCPTFTSSGEPLYRDTTHLRPFFVRDRGGFIDETMRPIGARYAAAVQGNQ
jgi:hypothetical protein